MRDRFSKKPLWWTGFLILLATLYLLPEAIFNARLVEVAGGDSLNSDSLHQIELFGRAISGIGVTLLLADIIQTRWVRTPVKGLTVFALLLIVVWPSVFLGQKILVERLLIEPSTPSERQRAFIISMLRGALLENAIEIDGVEFNVEHKSSPSEMTFLAIFGGLVYADSQLISAVEEKKHDILTAFVQSKTYRDFDDYYDQYDQMFDILADQYREYATGSQKYNDELANVTLRTGAWANVETEIDKGWRDYQNAQKAHIAKADARAQEYGPKIYNYYVQLNERCPTRHHKQQCVEDAHVSYKDMIYKAGLGHIDAEYWLIREQVSTTENIINSVSKGLSTGGASIIGQVFDIAKGGSGNFIDEKNYYTKNVEHYRERFLNYPEFAKLFTNQTGYPLNLDSKSDFRSHPKTTAHLINKMPQKGVVLPKDWTLNNREAFNAAVDKAIQQRAKEGWNKEMKQHGLTMMPNLSWEDWQMHPDIQSRIKERMGDSYVDGLLVGSNQKKFKKEVIDPNVKRTVNDIMQRINASETDFADDGPYADLGKQSLRAVLIPPISMFLSLFLVCMTVVKLPFKYWTFFSALIAENKRPRKNNQTSEALKDWRKNQGLEDPVDDNTEDLHDYGKVKRIKFVWIFKIVIPFVLVIIVPITTVSSIYTKEGSTVHYFLDKIEEKSSPVFSAALYWIFHAQPLMQPIGIALDERFYITKKFEPISIILDGISMKYIKEKKTSEINTFTETKLKVITKPENALVRIMNINPKYIDDIQLKAGSYDIEVSSPGYKTKRTWHKLLPGNQVIFVELEENKVNL